MVFELLLIDNQIIKRLRHRFLRLTLENKLFVKITNVFSKSRSNRRMIF